MNYTETIELLLHDLLRKRGTPACVNDELNDHPAILQLIEDLMAIREFTYGISNGDLSQNLSMKGYWAGALKALQSNLRHLTWQTSMIASGDFSQRIDFMGDFSASFNIMIQRLKQAEENEKKYMTELEKREAQLKESEQKYRLIAENMDDMIVLMDDDKKVIYCSPSIKRLLGYTAADFIELSLTQHLLPFITIQLGKIAEQDLAAPPVLMEVEQQRKDGEIIWLESLMSIAKDEEGQNMGFLCVIRNITQRKLAENDLQQSYERRLKNDFFMKLLNGDFETEADGYNHAYRLGIQLPNHFSLYFLSIDDSGSFISEVEVNVLEQRQKNMDALIDQLTNQEATIAWEVPEGIGILSAICDSNHKSKEIQLAESYIDLVSLSFPGLQAHIGVADYFDSLTHIALRFKHAQSAVRIGKRIWSQQMVYHFDDCGVYQVLIPFADSDESDMFVKKTLGPLLEYDQKNQTELVDTLEKILSGLSLKEVGKQTFFHYKTIQNRKQRIENILNVSLDSAEVRTMLGTAIHLLRMISGKG
ncbi:PAS domain S-box protein [Pelosinus propionicus]|uniref:PAS domain S-box-containing protein n=1 Tax=Pelosinus propionicus DSM 13327 TaxID=1123291 RepID=A0A1I4I524_9FIRM|nr:PAS domain S-box protein [Pelosinus propionicus]SFL48826.1 PAS domain S-box-containing protein [Pelosinus propionicus DSM 13327]